MIGMRALVVPGAVVKNPYFTVSNKKLGAI